MRPTIFVKRACWFGLRIGWYKNRKKMDRKCQNSRFWKFGKTQERGGIAATCRPTYGGARQDRTTQIKLNRLLAHDWVRTTQIRRAQPGWSESEPCKSNQTDRWLTTAREIARSTPFRACQRACRRVSDLFPSVRPLFARFSHRFELWSYFYAN